MRTSILAVGVTAALVLSACDGPENSVIGPEDQVATSASQDMKVSPAGKAFKLQLSQAADRVDAELMALMKDVNVQLEADGKNVRVGVAEWLGMGLAGRLVFFRDAGNKQLPFHFVPRDPRREWSGPPGPMNDDITWAVDQTADAVPSKGGLTEPQTTSAIVRAMGTWDGQGCSEIPLTRNPTYGMDVGVLAGSPYIFADVQHAGWGDIDFPGGVLGATFTFMFVDGNGNPTDIDRDRKIDVAFREIYYDSSWSWAIGGGVNDVDVESVAVHEMGHGLSQAHFGKLFGTYANGRLHFAPMALMNAGYMGIQRDLLGTDTGGHCGIWASWPNL